MPVIKTTPEQTKLLARLMRSEAEGEGEPGMLMVGNVGVNRVLSNCLDFKGIRTIEQMVFQSPGGFEATTKPYFYKAARTKEIRLAKRAIRGDRFDPSRYSLWFFRPSKKGVCRPTWYKQARSGRYRNHCFYQPTQDACPLVYRF